MGKIFSNLFDRLKEPSSQAAITTGLMGLGLNLEPTIIQSGVFVLAGVTGFLAFFVKEGK